MSSAAPQYVPCSECQNLVPIKAKRCPNCSTALANCEECGGLIPEREMVCRYCGTEYYDDGDEDPEDLASEEDRAATLRYLGLSEPLPFTVVRSYRGRQQQDAMLRFQDELPVMAAFDYRVAAQSWAQGQWGAGAFLVAIILFIFLIGILVFIYMLLVKPDGTLTVTYALRP